MNVNPDGYAAAVTIPTWTVRDGRRTFTLRGYGHTYAEAIEALQTTFEAFQISYAPVNSLRWSDILDDGVACPPFDATKAAPLFQVRVSPIRFGQGEVS